MIGKSSKLIGPTPKSLANKYPNRKVKDEERNMAMQDLLERLQTARDVLRQLMVRL